LLGLLDGGMDVSLGLDELAWARLVLVVLIVGLFFLFLHVIVLLVVIVIIIVTIRLLLAFFRLLLRENVLGLLVSLRLDQLFRIFLLLGSSRLLFLGSFLLSFLFCLFLCLLLSFGLLLGKTSGLSLLSLDELLALHHYSLDLGDVGVRRDREVDRSVCLFLSLLRLRSLLYRRGLLLWLLGGDWCRSFGGLNGLLLSLRSLHWRGRFRFRHWDSSGLRFHGRGLYWLSLDHWSRSRSGDGHGLCVLLRCCLLLLHVFDSSGDVLRTGTRLLSSDRSGQVGIRCTLTRFWRR
jgi:hypothetical protein